MGTLQLPCIQIAIALLLLAQVKSTTEKLSAHPNNTNNSCIADERSSLITFRAGLSDRENRFSSWKGDDCCRWKGVNCSNKTGHVFGLDLRGPYCHNSYVGTLVLGGNISSLLGLQHLQYLDLSCNRFEELQIPEFLGSLHNLRYIDLSMSNFVGRIPPQLGNLSNLRYLSLDSSYGDTFSRDLTWLSRLASLEHLDMAFVNLSIVTNWLPVVNMLSSLKVLRLPICQLRNSADSLQFSNLTSLETLDFSGNHIRKRGSPNWFWDVTSLKYLDVSWNGFYGPFPDEIGELTKLTMLDLSSNNLDGVIHEGHLSRLNMLDALDLSHNFIAITNLIFLDLSYNSFFGNLPAWIGQKLPSLAFLRLRSNMFYGHIPEELMNIVNLQYLDLAYNNITGSIPRSIGNYKRMIQRRDGDDELEDAFNYGAAVGDNALDDYSENFTIITKGQERLYTGEVIYMVNLDLSCNILTGEIPEEIATLVALKSLNLSWNTFSGTIPEKIGALVQAESLDLSHNELTGEIPPSLSALTSLSRLNLSYNNLTGVIPSGNQLQTLEDPSYIYIGNAGLCGPPLPRHCSQLEPIPATQKLHEDAGDVVSFFIAMGSGYVIAIWLVFCTFLFKRKWRVSWFSRCDSLYDRVYVLVAVTWASLIRRNV
ncbi:receptor-like protein EIX2 [Lolium rigidum]|uniref:receptor-like protein EIX2 n=1 Tax=Lolium rigidum TaxID=89674 RepID=UPI001F5DF1CD|nr:receptor-like protein EIX2 [Lolium rigidum]